MKAVFLLAIVVAAAVLVPETEANFFRNVGRVVGSGARHVRNGLATVGRGVIRGGRHVRKGASNFRRGFRSGFNGRGKRSVLALTPDTVNALDKVSTFSLDLPTTRELFVVSDENKNALLDDQEVQVFLGMIEGLTGAYDQPQEPVSETSTPPMPSGSSQ